MAAPKQQREQIGTGAACRLRRFRQRSLHPRAESVECVAGLRRRYVGRGDRLGRQLLGPPPSRQAVAQERDGCRALAHCTGTPRHGSRLQDAGCRREKGGNGPHAPDRGVESNVDRGERPRDERDEAENRFARPQRRVAMNEVAALVLGDLDFEERIGERQVDVVWERNCLTAGRSSRRVGRASACANRVEGSPAEDRPKRIHLRNRGFQAFRRPIGQQMIVLVHARESRLHGSSTVVVFEKPIERHDGGQASGRLTHLRSRNDCSTAFTTSCTHAPSSKLPSFSGLSERISVMKLAIRLA